MNTVAERSGLRRSLLQLASLLLLTLLSLALMAQFAVWSLQRAHDRTVVESAHVVAALDASRLAQVQFKRQVQEWKNLLLRGADPLERARYHDAFRGAGDRVEEALDVTARHLNALGDHDHDAALSAIREAHARLGEQYHAALLDVSGGHWSPFEADRAVRGLDRPLDSSIDQLANMLLAESNRRAALQQTAMDRRYHALRYGLWVTITAGLVLVGSLLWSALRSLGVGH